MRNAGSRAAGSGLRSPAPHGGGGGRMCGEAAPSTWRSAHGHDVPPSTWHGRGRRLYCEQAAWATAAAGVIRRERSGAGRARAVPRQLRPCTVMGTGDPLHQLLCYSRGKQRRGRGGPAGREIGMPELRRKARRGRSYGPGAAVLQRQERAAEYMVVSAWRRRAHGKAGPRRRQSGSGGVRSAFCVWAVKRRPREPGQGSAGWGSAPRRGGPGRRGRHGVALALPLTRTVPAAARTQGSCGPSGADTAGEKNWVGEWPLSQ